MERHANRATFSIEKHVRWMRAYPAQGPCDEARATVAYKKLSNVVLWNDMRTGPRFLRKHISDGYALIGNLASSSRSLRVDTFVRIAATHMRQHGREFGARPGPLVHFVAYIIGHLYISFPAQMLGVIAIYVRLQDS